MEVGPEEKRQQQYQILDVEAKLDDHNRRKCYLFTEEENVIIQFQPYWTLDVVHINQNLFFGPRWQFIKKYVKKNKPASFFCHGLRFCIVCFVFCHFSLLIKVLFCIFAQMLSEPIGKLRASTHPHYSTTMSMWEKSYKLSSSITFCVVNTLLWAVFLEKKL